MNTASPRILIVDDEINICRTCVKILSKMGYAVEYALNGYDALKRLADEPFDVVVTDLKMSSLGGMEVVRRVLEELPSGGFPRSPADWPALPDMADEASWKADRTVLRHEHDAIAEAVARFDPRRLDERARGSGSYRNIDLIHGVVMHNTYHTGQIQSLKRLSGQRHESG